MFEKFALETKYNEAINITPQVREIITKSGIKDGICIVSVPHTTAGLCLHSFWDPNGWTDMMVQMDRMIPTRVDFKHDSDPPHDASGHVKSALMNTNMSLIVKDGDLLFGRSQGILFAEFDGPRSREVFVKVM